MPRFFFHYRDGDELYRDEVGEDVESLDLVRGIAERHAKEILAELMHDHGRVLEQQVEATTEDEEVVTVVPIKIVMGMSLDEVETARQAEGTDNDAEAGKRYRGL